LGQDLQTVGVDVLVFRRKWGSSCRLFYTSAGFALIAGLLVVILTSCEAGLTTEQKLEDFRYLFGIIRDNHPYLELKARVEGYDWLANEAEFQETVANSRNDKEFVQVINRMLQMINSGHTTIMSPDLYQGICALPEELKPWLDECAKTDAEKVARWYSLLSNPFGYPKGQTLPFRACYCGGECVVYYVAESLASNEVVSRIPVFMATGMGLNSDFTANEETHTAPDVLIERDPRDIIKLVQATSDGRTLSPPDAEYDTALRQCLKLALQTP